MKFSFRDSVSFCATRRPSVSAVPPGAKGTTTRTGFEGQGCAHAFPLEIRTVKNKSKNLCDMAADSRQDLADRPVEHRVSYFVVRGRLAVDDHGLRARRARQIESAGHRMDLQRGADRDEEIRLRGDMHRP